MSTVKSFRIGKRQVGGGAPCYIVAEVGTNHNGSLETALEYIDVFAKAGADAVKFQSIQTRFMFHPESFDAAFEAFWENLELPEEWLPELVARAAKRRVHLLSTPCYQEAIPGLVAAGVPAIKIASRQAARQLELVRDAARTGLPLIVSLGLCHLGDAHRCVAAVREAGGEDLALLRCTPRYPASPGAANLAGMATLRGAFDVPVGYSDHTLGAAVPLGAVAMGAKLLEKHVTLDRTQSGPDHHFAMEPGEFRELVEGVRAIEAARGDGALQYLPEEDHELYEDSAHYLVLTRGLKAGQRLTRGRLRFLRTWRGIPLEELPQALGRPALQDLPAGHVLTWGDLGPQGDA